MQRQPLEVQTLYAEFQERLAAYEAQRTIGHLSGSFVTKSVKGRQYYYFQYLEPGGARKQVYVGPKDAASDAVAARFATERAESSEDGVSIQRLASLLRAGGAMVTDTASARVLAALSDAGIFKLGGVLVGTHAFIVIGNLLGAAWSGAALRTQDVDVAAETGMSVVLPDAPADIPSVLESLEMGFLPVPALNPRSPSTSFKVRGRGVRVDLVTPTSARRSSPVELPRFKASAQPLKFLDLVIESAVRGAVVDGGGILVNVPDPARFALHKLIVAGERPATMHSKREKDLWQAAQVLEVLVVERQGDVRRAWDAVVARGRGWTKRVESGNSAMAALAPEVSAALSPMLRR